MRRYLIPLVVFAVLVLVLAVGLNLDPSLVPSPLIGKPAPEFTLPRVKDTDKTLSRSDLLGKVALFNVWASWCTACREEHPVFMELARMNRVPIYGLNYKDQLDDARRWLTDLGDPYVATGFDSDGRVGIEWGVYGVPETFVLDRNGLIRYKRIGAVTRRILQEEILPLITQLEGEQE